MGLLKWIGGYLGWVTGGPIGALIGYLLGKVFDNGLDSARIGGGQNYDGGQSRSTGGYNTTGRPGYSTGSRSSGGHSAGEQRNSFLISLLVLSSAVIRADGRFLQSETEYVKGFVRRNFGDAAVSDAMRILDELNRKVDKLRADLEEIKLKIKACDQSDEEPEDAPEETPEEAPADTPAEPEA